MAIYRRAKKLRVESPELDLLYSRHWTLFLPTPLTLMKALITGITGFVGKHLAEHLLASGDAVIGCSRTGAWDDADDCAVVEDAKVFAWDITQGLSDEACRCVTDFAPDTIYHLAAMSVPSRCGGEVPTAEAVAVNVEGTRAVIDLANGQTTPPRLLLASSCHVYAPVDESSRRVHEDAPLQPITAYGKTKLTAEQVVLEGAKRGLSAVVARAFHHSGPGQQAVAMLPEWCHQLARGDDPISVRCLDAWLDLSDVRDVVRAYRQLLVQGGAEGVYNIGRGTALRSGDLLERLFLANGHTVKINEMAPGSHHEPIANRDRLDAATHWQPPIPIEQTIADTLEYWRKRVCSER